MDEDKLKLIQECHDSPVMEYPRQTKTYDLLSRSNSLNQMRKDVD
jgi:hypothetical protein